MGPARTAHQEWPEWDQYEDTQHASWQVKLHLLHLLHSNSSYGAELLPTFLLSSSSGYGPYGR
jgi:hypothetical protein